MRIAGEEAEAEDIFEVDGVAEAITPAVHGVSASWTESWQRPAVRVLDRVEIVMTAVVLDTSVVNTIDVRKAVAATAVVVDSSVDKIVDVKEAIEVTLKVITAVLVL